MFYGVSSGNPTIKEKIDLDISVNKLRTLYSAYLENNRQLQENVAVRYPHRIAALTEKISALNKDIAAYTTEEFTAMKIGDKPYTEKKEAGEVFFKAVSKSDVYNVNNIGSYKGFDMLVSFNKVASSYSLTLKGHTTLETIMLGKDYIGNLTRIENVLRGMQKALENCSLKLEDVQKQFETAKSEVNKPFPQQAELDEKEKRLIILNAELSSESKSEPNKTQPQNNDIDLN